MSVIQSIIDLKNRVQAIFINKNFVKYSLIIGLILFLTSLTSGVIVANFLDPAFDGYDIIRNYISDLGSFNYTAIPHFLDFAAIITSLLLIPVALYFKKTICTYQQVKEESLIKKIPKLFLSNFGLLSMFIALIGFAGIGFFSEDLSAHICDYYGFNPFDGTIFKNFHYFFSIVVFAGFIFSGFFIGAYYILFPKSTAQKLKIEKYWYIFILIGLEMLIWPTIHAVSFIIGLPPSEPFHEWFMLITIFIWIIPTLLLLLRQIVQTSEGRQKGSISKIFSRGYKFLTNPKTNKYSIAIGIILFALTVISGYIIAQFDLSDMPFSSILLTVSDSAGFNIFQDYFSNLGSYRFTPIPQIFNLGLIVSSIFLIPPTFYIFKIVKSNEEDIPKLKLILKRFLLATFVVSWIVAFIGCFGIGVFSEDVAEYIAYITGPVIFNFNWHHIFAGILFVSFLISGLALGLLILIFPNDIAKIFELKHSKIIIYALSIIMLILVPIVYSIGLITLLPFWEWMYFIAICGWILPILVLLYPRINSKLEK
ncbi:MAG: DUF998 domain-containing protein [Promethearchaeota archaeon]|nr:MAG: DUF998 domain-containing protein [Candidatus Lokiarchaeota archaeon]